MRIVQPRVAAPCLTPRAVQPKEVLPWPEAKERHRPLERRSALVQGRHHLRAARPRLRRQQRRRHRRLPRPDRRSSTTSQDLGVTAIWLLPFYPSPLSDDGYDIADYTDINPAYGTLRRLQDVPRRGPPPRPARHHRAGDQPHLRPAPLVPARPPRAARQPLSATSTSGATRPTSTREARIIFKDFEPSNWTWDPVAKAYYWHRFYSPPARPELRQPGGPRGRSSTCSTSGSTWASTACGSTPIPYLYEREGTNCENLPETHAFLKAAAARTSTSKFPNRMLLAEANQWPEDAVAYFGDGDECHMAFHFPLMPRLFMAIRMEDRFPIIDILQQTPAIPETCQWAMFLRNHDELTLEMVTDEERDYMYRVYAQDPQARINLGIRRRLAPLLENDRAQDRADERPALLAAGHAGALLRRRDRHGRQHLPRRPQRRAHADAVERRPQRRLLAGQPAAALPAGHHRPGVPLRGGQRRGAAEQPALAAVVDEAPDRPAQAATRRSAAARSSSCYPENHKVLAFIRRYRGARRILVVANLSRFAQYVELDLSRFQGMVPVEMFGRTPFPPIGERPYLLTLGPYAFYWFSLEPPAPRRAGGGAPSSTTCRLVTAADDWRQLFPAEVEAAAAWPSWPPVLPATAGTPAAPRTIRRHRDPRRRAGGRGPREAGCLHHPGAGRVHRRRARRPTCCPSPPPPAPRPSGCWPTSPMPVVARWVRRASLGRARRRAVRPLGDGRHARPSWRRRCATAVQAQPHFDSLAARPSCAPRTLGPSCAARACAEPTDRAVARRHARAGEQSNTSAVFANQLVLKIFRRAEEGVNPDLEIGRFLRREHRRSAPCRGCSARSSTSGPRRAADAGACSTATCPTRATPGTTRSTRWACSTSRRCRPAVPTRSWTMPAWRDDARAGRRRGAARRHRRRHRPVPRLGRDAGAAHRRAAPGAGVATPTSRFAPEPFTTLYQRSLYQSMRGQVRPTLALVRRRLESLPEEAPAEARDLVAGARRRLLEHVRAHPPATHRRAQRIRVHGDYHLGQVLTPGATS